MRLRWAGVLLLAGACTPGPAPTKAPQPHPYFRIDDGPHRLGANAESGPVQCVSCHSLADTNYAQFECTGCHEHAKETMDSVHHVAGYVYADAACYACHRDARAAYAPSAASDPAQDVLVVSQVPTWSGTSIVSVTEVDAGVAMVMNHESAQVPVEATACSTCHVDAARTDQRLFFPGVFHASLFVQKLRPSGCSDCHGSAAPIGFVGPVDARRNPPSGEMKHDAVEWADGGPTPNALVTADCSTCHAPPTETNTGAHWATHASFHTLPDGGLVNPRSCLDCHANTRPGTVTSAVFPNLAFNHAGAVWLGDCVSCHASSAETKTWTDGKFHLASTPAPASCQPCHTGERPPVGTHPQFDYGVNVLSIPHGDNQDCALCHKDPAASWDAGLYAHDAGPVANTCMVCHSSQRPSQTVQTSPDSGFDHAFSGTGDCFGCHHLTNRWDAGEGYPGGSLISSTDQFIIVNEITLKKTSGLVTGSVTAPVTLYNAMLHTSLYALGAGPPPGNPATCPLCHTGNSFINGQFHTSVIMQPTACLECHANMRPAGIVQHGVLQPMDHSVAGAATLDCWTCHLDPGGTWDGGTFHANVAAAPGSCVTCHFPLMAIADGGEMNHRSTQVTVQSCDRCHATALASQAWDAGTFHSTNTPTACVDCHASTAPAGRIQSSVDGQFISHQAPPVVAKDCAFCHTTALQNLTVGWAAGARLHVAGVSPTGCSVCHAPNAPTAPTDSPTLTSASTAPAGTHDQIVHTDLNVTARDCNFCHRQTGVSWAGATLHPNFISGSGLVMNGSTGRCSNCHLLLRPGPTFAAQDHSAFQGPGTTDCSSCHQWPGTGDAGTPNWHRPAGPSAPPTISIGGFTLTSPPASNATTTEPGLNSVPHPTVSSGTACTTCHATASGGHHATGYDHTNAPATGCAGCHEAGSDLVGTPWSLNAAGSMMLTAQCNEGAGTVADRGGDTRPIGITAISCSSGSTGQSCGGQNCSLNHFYPSDCGECHARPAAAPATVQTGATFVANWKFQHFFGAPAQASTCCHCHGGGSTCP